MNVNLVRLRSLTVQVKRLADAQERTAHALELYLASLGIRVSPIKDEEVLGEPDVSYASDEKLAVQEAEEELARLGYESE